MKTKIRLTIIAIAILLIISFPCHVFAEDYTATTMRLLRHEGTVEITDASGKKRAVLENVRFSSGEAMTTGKESSASVGLDAEKVVTLDEQSRVEFSKKANSIELTLTAGQILLDVQKKLEKEEKLDVRTSTMTIGIRGTIVNVETLNASSEDESGSNKSNQNATTYLKVLEGNAEVTYTDPSGAEQSMSVPCGKKAVVADEDGDGRADTAPAVEDLEVPDYTSFLIRQIIGDPEMKERLEKSISNLDEILSLGDETVFKKRITLVAQSASKIYDGTPLTRPNDVLVYGLPENFTISVSAGGSITDAGEASNPISSYRIYDAKGKDVTDRFTNVTTIEGKLVVDPAPLTVWTGSAEKVYDGTPLTCQDAGLGNYPVHEEGPIWRNLSYVTIGSEQSFEVQTLYGICGKVYVHGTNPLTGENKEIELMAGQKLTVWLSDEADKKSIAYTITDVSEAELPDEVLQIYADNPELLEQACADAMWETAVMKDRIATLTASKRSIENVSMRRQDETAGSPRGTAPGSAASGNGLTLTTYSAGHATVAKGDTRSLKRLDSQPTGISSSDVEHVTRYELDVSKDCADSLLRDSVNVRINIDTTITDYNDRPLGSEESQFSEIAIDDSIIVTATGNQTEVGESVNTYEIKWGNAIQKNYVLTENLGTLKVTMASPTPTNRPAAIPTNAPTAVPTISPTPTKKPTSTPKPTSSPTPTKKPTSTPKPTSSPTPTPTPTYDMEVVLTAASPTKTYDGKYLADDTVTATGLPDGFTFEASVEGRQKDAGSSANEIMSYKIFKSGTDVTSLFTNVTLKNGTITVEKAPATVTTGSDEKVFDGSALTKAEASITGILPGETATVNATGTVTDADSVTNTYKIIWDTADKNNYELTENLGTLTVNPLPVIFDFSLLDETDYSGWPNIPEWISCYYYEIADENEIEEESCNIKYVSSTSAYSGEKYNTAINGVFNLTGGGTARIYVAGIKDVGSYSYEPEVTFTAGKAKNYAISYASLTINIIPAELQITTGSASKQYDGTALTCSNVSVDGLLGDDEYIVTVTTTGTVTDEGATADNTYVINWYTVNSSNYNLNDTLGKLKILPAELSARPTSIKSAASALTGIDLLSADAVKKILNYADPIISGTPVRHIDEEDSSERDDVTTDSSTAKTGTDSDSSASPTSTEKPGTNPGNTDSQAEKPQETVPPPADSTISDPETGGKTESCVPPIDQEGTDSQAETQTDSSISHADESEPASHADTQTDSDTASDSSGVTAPSAETDSSLSEEGNTEGSDLSLPPSDE